MSGLFKQEQLVGEQCKNRGKIICWCYLLYYYFRPSAQSQRLENCRLVWNGWNGNGLSFISKDVHKGDCINPLYGSGLSFIGKGVHKGDCINPLYGSGLSFISKGVHKGDCINPFYGSGHSLEEIGCLLWIIDNGCHSFSQYLEWYQLPFDYMNLLEKYVWR